MDVWENVGAILILISGLGAFAISALFIMSIVWAWRDAEDREKSGPLIALLVFLSWPFGLMLWYVFRPKVPTNRPLR
jgi:hypothetical protein